MLLVNRLSRNASERWVNEVQIIVKHSESTLPSLPLGS